MALILFLISICSFAVAAPGELGAGHTPPPQATQACQGKSQGAACRFDTPRGILSGACRNVPNAFACVPDGGMQQRGNNARPAQNRPVGQGGPVSQPLPASAPIANTTSAKSRVVDTAQVYCFDDNGAVITCPQRGEKFFGQDAQFIGTQPAYRDNGDGTVSDLNTGLVWQKAHNAKRVGYSEARRDCEALVLGGKHDWRLPSLKELFSIADFSGSQGTGRFYLDSRYFNMAYPSATDDMGREASHHPEMMGQTWSSTLYTGNHMGRGVEAAFFFNFFDGHIKNAPTSGPFSLFHRCVRGAEYLGHNDFSNNKDGSVSDNATGLTWQQADDGKTRDWPEALRYCSTLNLAGKRYWRLPNVKELQSIVDYSRNDPAIDTRIFTQTDRNGWYWSSTTHGDNTRMASYVCFGKCTSSGGVDTHGAGAQRADPKTGNPTSYSSLGGQSDAVRIDNYVRCVR
ncbi:Lcl C-terminal domain-containing protein [Sulfuricella denitrificans]|nr:DUF1566 domain-containing protein [Sulfuricella denitrificans]